MNMRFTSLDPAGLNSTSPLGKTSAHDERAARRAATEFEALLLKQLTAALSPAQDEEEEGLFNSSDSSFYRQMFTEQLATAMARNGGVGLANTVLNQLGVKAPAHGIQSARRAVELARTVRDGGADVLSNTPAPAPTITLANAPVTATAQPVTLAAPSVKLVSEGNAAPASQPATAPVLLSTAASAPRAVSGATPTLEPLAAAPAAINAPTAINTAAASAPAAAVKLQLPLNGRVSSNFGARRDPLQGQMRRHAGVDIVAPAGTPIAAAAAGTVVFAGRRGGYGNLVELEHADGRRTRYAHTSRILVEVGQQVQRGQPIATVGSTGRSTGPHLHFEVKENGAQVNPLQAVAKDSAPTRR